MAKKKKLEEDAWLWMSQPVLPGMVSNPFFKYSFTAPLPDVPSQGTAFEEGRSWGTETPRSGFGKAWGHYAVAGLIDPKMPLEAAGWSAALGISRLGGYGVAAAVGLTVVGISLTVIDPQHKWEGGLDEYPLSGAHPNLNKEILFGAGSWGSVV